MKYLIKGEVGLKIGGEGTIFPEICDFHIGAILTDESMSLLTGQISSPPRLEASGARPHFPIATPLNWWQRNL